MPFDGSAWDETTPTNANLANEIDDNMRDMKTGVRGRLAQEHLWPSSQSATNEGGLHRYMTLAGQTGAPTLAVGTNTQLAAIWCSSGSKNVLVTDSAGSNYIIVQSGKGPYIASGVYSATGTLGEMVIGSSGGQIKILAPGSSGQILTASTTADVLWASNSAMMVVTNYAAGLSSGTAVTNTNCKIYFGQGTLSSGTADISGLGFANATSYGVGLVRFNASDVSQALQVSSQSATGFKARDSLGNNHQFQWIAIGT